MPASSSTVPVPSRGFRRLALTTAVVAVVLIALGGAVRATDSGLACPTWPGCFTAGDFIPPADLNVWLEHTHRLVAGTLGLLIATQLVWVLARYRHVRGLMWATAGAAVAVNIQALLGAIVVWQLLRAELVTAHLGLGTALMSLLLYVAVRAHTPLRRPTGPLWRLAVGVTALTWVQILVGGHTTGVGAGLAYADDPLLGVFSVAPVTSEGDLTNIAHRVLAVAVAAAVGILAARIRRARLDGWVARLPRIAVWLVGLQIVLGVTNLASDLSFVSVIPHLAVASWILGALVLLLLAMAAGAAQADRPSAPSSTPLAVTAA